MRWGLGVILLGLSSCYTPKDLKLPHQYQSLKKSPYVSRTDEENNINYYTLRNSKGLIKKARKRVPRLTEAVEESEGKRKETLEIILLKNKAYIIVERQFKEDGVKTKGTKGLYSLYHKCIILRGWDPETMVHETVHLIDYQDGKQDLSEKQVIIKEREICKKLGL